jgi:uncharacterized protein
MRDGGPASPPEHRHPRRIDRSRDVAWIEDFLRRGEVAVLAAVRDGRPLCLPRLYAYDQNRKALYLHGAHGGELGSLLGGMGTYLDDGEGGWGKGGVEPGSGAGQGVSAIGAPLALTVFEMGRLLPAPEAAEFSMEFGSVVVHGHGVLVDDPDEAMHGLRLLMRKYAPHLRPGQDYRDMTSEEVARTSVIRVDIQAWSGKEKTEAGEFPGAYWYREVVAAFVLR